MGMHGINSEETAILKGGPADNLVISVPKNYGLYRLNFSRTPNVKPETITYERSDDVNADGLPVFTLFEE